MSAGPPDAHRRPGWTTEAATNAFRGATPILPDNVVSVLAGARLTWRCLHCPARPRDERAAKAHAGHRGHVVASELTSTTYLGTERAAKDALQALLERRAAR